MAARQFLNFDFATVANQITRFDNADIFEVINTVIVYETFDEFFTMIDLTGPGYFEAAAFAVKTQPAGSAVRITIDNNSYEFTWTATNQLAGFFPLIPDAHGLRLERIEGVTNESAVLTAKYSQCTVDPVGKCHPIFLQPLFYKFRFEVAFKTAVNQHFRMMLNAGVF